MLRQAQRVVYDGAQASQHTKREHNDYPLHEALHQVHITASDTWKNGLLHNYRRPI